MEYLQTFFQLAQTYWLELDHQIKVYVWYASGGFMLLTILGIWYPFFRRGLGHTKFRGTWYTETQFEQLLLMLKEDQESGRRVMRRDEIDLLRSVNLGEYGGLGFDQVKKGYW